MSNSAEGYERNSDREFRHFLSLAKGSASESRAQLYVALDAGLLQRADFERLYGLSAEVGRLIGGFMRYLNPNYVREEPVQDYESPVTMLEPPSPRDS